MPDASIHPTATGQAKDTVDAHKDPQDLVFYSGKYWEDCPQRMNFFCRSNTGRDSRYKPLSLYRLLLLDWVMATGWFCP